MATTTIMKLATASAGPNAATMSTVKNSGRTSETIMGYATLVFLVYAALVSVAFWVMPLVY